MSWFTSLRTTLGALFGRTSAESEMDEEMRFHLEMETRRNIERGMSSADARRAALVAFGGVERLKEEIRDERDSPVFEHFTQDVRYAARTLRRRPGFTAVATTTLALGIGATTALFGVVKSVLLTPLPYGDPSSLVMVWSAWKGFDQTWLSYDEYEGWKDGIHAFRDVAIYSDGAVTLTEGDEPERLRAAFITRQTFDVLGVHPALGRGFSAEEDRPNGARVIVLGHDVWQRRFGGDPSVIGRDVQVNGAAAQVVGVMPAGFRLPLDFGADGATQLWLPLATDAEREGGVPGPTFARGGGSHGFYGIARLTPGATSADANRQLDEMVKQLKRDGYISSTNGFRAFTVPMESQVTGRVRPALLIVFGAVAFVLLIACANVAGLLLVRGEGRKRELALRVALGAGASRLTRQLLTETMALTVLGGAAGVALAALAVRLVRLTAPASFPRIAETRLDPLVLVFALGVACLAALLTGILPAMQALRLAPSVELKEGGRSATVGGGRLRWRQGLVAVEVALAVVLVIGAGLMVRSVRNLFAIDTGLETERILTMRLSTPSVWYPDSMKVSVFHDELRRRVAALPGVERVGLVRILPLATEMGDWGLRVEGYTPPPNEGTPGDWQVVSPGYFETMGLHRVAGRFLDERDAMDAPLAMVINKTFAERYLAGRDPIGRRVRIGGSPDSLQYTIVGVVGNVHHNGLTNEVKPQFYVAAPQFAKAPGNTSRSMTLVVRSANDPMSLYGPVRGAIRSLDPRLPISDVRTMDDVVVNAMAAPRFAMELLGVFGVLALVLSAIGIYGVVSQVVASRAQEFGIRAALGASPKELVTLALQSGLQQTVLGLALGVGAALALTRAMGALLQGVSPSDPLTFALVVAVTGLVAIIASLGPARWAAKTDPGKVLQQG